MKLLFANAPDVLVESEDGACQQERLGYVVEQPGGHVVDLDDLVRHERDAAHDEQHRAGVLGYFEAFLFHALHCFSLLHHGIPGRAP